MSSNDINQRIWQVVASIPKGKVSTYGDVARFAGLGAAARRVGPALGALPGGSKVPWYRVINAAGRLSLSADIGQRQKDLLEAEGVEFSISGKVDMRRFRWQP